MTTMRNRRRRGARSYDPPRSTGEVRSPGAQFTFTQRVLVVFGIAIVLGLTLWLLWLSLEVLLLIFAGGLLAVFLRGLSTRLSGWTRMPQGWALAVVLLGTLGSLIGFGWFVAPRIAEQIGELQDSLAPAVQQLQTRFAEWEWSEDLLSRLPDPLEFLSSQTGVLAQATGIFSTTFAALLRFFIVIFVGVYLAIDPGLYVRGILRLIPQRRRPRAREVLHAVGDMLWWWLMGRLLSMAAVGVMTGVGLWLLGVPLAFPLGVIAALLDFIPNIGPWLAAIPGVLLALVQSPTLALYVALWYLLVQQIESYIITPIVQQKTVKLPPVLTIFAQVLLTFTVGGIGLILASPLAAVVVLLVKMLYVEDVLGDRMDRPVEATLESA